MSNPPSGYNTPKTNWQSADVVLPTDLNRIEGNINAIEAGTRTVDPSQAPSSNQGTLRQLLDWFANRIRAITGAANWYDAPPATLSGLNTSIANHKSASPIDHPDGSVTIAKLAASTMTSAGGTEPNRLARTDASGAVGLATNALLLKGRDIAAIVDNLYWSSWPSRASGTTQDLQGITYGGMWVVVGGGGTIRTSTNGITWTARTSGTTQYLWGVAYGDNMWVAVGLSGTILTSSNGISWTSRTSGTTQDLFGVAYGGGMWVVVGDDGTILTSSDGISWTSRTSGTTSSLPGIAYGGNMWVAVGYGGAILTSSDGISWTSRTSGTSYLWGIAYGGGMWVVVGLSGRILTSSNGISWTRRTSGTAENLYGVAYGGNMWIAVGGNGAIIGTVPT